MADIDSSADADGNNGKDGRPEELPAAPALNERDGALLAALLRLEALLDREKEMLAHGNLASLDDIARRKGQCLLDLVRFSNAFDVSRFTLSADGEGGVRGALVRVREKLSQSEASLARYLDAVKEITGIVSDGIYAAESDGTYSNTGLIGKFE